MSRSSAGGGFHARPDWHGLSGDSSGGRSLPCVPDDLWSRFPAFRSVGHRQDLEVDKEALSVRPR